MNDEFELGQKWLVEQFIASSEGLVDDFSWTRLNDSKYDGAILKTNRNDHIFFTRERIEDSANGLETRKRIRVWIKDRLRSEQISSRKEFAKCIIQI